MAQERKVDRTLGDKLRYATNCGIAVLGAVIRILMNASANASTRGFSLLGGGLLLTESQQAFIKFLIANFDLDVELSSNAMACIANALRSNTTKDAESGSVYVAIVGDTELARTQTQSDNFDALCVDLDVVDDEGYVVDGKEDLYEQICELFANIRTCTAVATTKVTARDFDTTNVSRTNMTVNVTTKAAVQIGGAKVRPATTTAPAVDANGKLVKLAGETAAQLKARQEAYDKAAADAAKVGG